MKKIICVLLAAVIVLPVYKTAALSASAAVVINGDNADILYSHNPDVRLPMASTTKIMTALILAERADDLDGQIIATKEMVTVEGSSMGLLPGDIVSYRALLYGMMLASGNDAANAAAIAIGGSIADFAELMNGKAAELGLKNTHFVTPSGLDAEGHYTTAYELALIAREALRNKDFAEAAAAKSATLCFGNPPYLRKINNHNRLLSMYDDIIGVKTGFTKKSGRCLVSAAKKDGKYVIAVTLNDGDDWADHRFLLDTGLSAIEVYNYEPDLSDFSIPVTGGESATLSVKTPGACFSKPKGAEVTTVVCVPHFLYAPVEDGGIIGNIEYYCYDRLIYKSNVVSVGIKQKKYSKLKQIFERFNYMLSLI